MADDFNISIKVTPQGLTKALVDLNNLEQTGNRATSVCRGLAQALNELKSVDISNLGDIFAVANQGAGQLSGRTTEIISNFQNLHNVMGSAVHPIAQINENVADIEAELTSARAVASDYAEIMQGVSSAFDLGDRAYNWSKSFVTETINARSEMEGLERQLSAVMGGAEKAKDALPGIKEMANTTVAIDTEGAIKGVSAFMRMGDSAEEAQNKVRALANATAYFGGDAEQVKNALVQLEQLSSKTSGFGEDIRSLQNSLSGIGGIVREKFGVEEFGDLSEKLGLTGADVVAGIFEELNKLPQVDGGISETFSQIDSSFKDLKASMGESFVPALNLAAESMDKLSTTVENTPDWAKKFIALGVAGAGVGGAFLVGASGVSQLFRLMKNGINQLGILRNNIKNTVSVQNIHNQSMKAGCVFADLFGISQKKLAQHIGTLELRAENAKNKLNANNISLKQQTETIENLTLKEKQLNLEREKATQTVNVLYEKYNQGIITEEQLTEATLQEMRALQEKNAVANELALAQEKLNVLGQEATVLKEKEAVATQKLAKEEQMLASKKASQKSMQMGMIGMGASIVGGMISSGYKSMAEENMDDPNKVRKYGYGEVVGDALTGIGIGAMTGNPYLAIAGGLVGGGIGVYNASKRYGEALKNRRKSSYMERYEPQIESLRDSGKDYQADYLESEAEYQFERGELDLSKEKDRKKLLELNKKRKDNRKTYEKAQKQDQKETAERNLEIEGQLEVNKYQSQGNEYMAKATQLANEYNKVMRDSKATDEEKTLATSNYTLALQELNKQEQINTVQRKGALAVSNATLSGNGNMAGVISAETEYKAVVMDVNSKLEDRQIAYNNLVLAQTQAKNAELAQSRGLEIAQAEFMGDNKKAKNIKALSDFEQIKNDPTKSLKEKWTAYYKYLSAMANNQVSEMKRVIDTQKKGIDELIKKREEQTNSVIAEIERERQAKSSYYEQGQMAVLTSGYMDTSLTPAQYSQEEIQRANQTVNMRKQIEENQKQQVDMALNGNTTNDLKIQQKNIENMEKYISENNLTGQKLLEMMTMLYSQVGNVSNILSYETKRNMA